MKNWRHWPSQVGELTVLTRKSCLRWPQLILKPFLPSPWPGALWMVASQGSVVTRRNSVLLLGGISLLPLLPLTPNKILINVAPCLLTTSRCGGIRSNLLNLTFRAPHTRTPNYLSRSSQIGFLTTLVTGPIFSSFIFLHVFSLWWPHPPESLLQNHGL